jgi:glucose 1-dehydrogenase
MGQLDGVIALVTGSDSGIGRAIAIAFAPEGAHVAVSYHSDRNGAEETRRRIEAAGRKALLRQLDVRVERSIDNMFAAIENELGAPFILVNNAGIGGAGKPVVESDPATFLAILKTDLYGPYLCCREFARRRKAAGGRGKVINITSVHEAIPSPKHAAYGAAKGGLLTFTRSLSLELAPDCINVNAIAPGLIRTPLTQARTDDPATRAQEMPNIPWHRPGRPEEVARLAVYLASADSDYVTGQSVTIDGGLEMNWGQGA